MCVPGAVEQASILQMEARFEKEEEQGIFPVIFPILESSDRREL